MIEQIICYLTSIAKASGYFETVFPFVRQMSAFISVGEKRAVQVWPAQYTTGGQADDVTIFDNKSGVAYFRQNGKVNISTPTKNQAPCNDELKFDFPIRLVGVVQKRKLTKDDAFSEERITRTLIQQLTIKHSTLTKELSAMSVTFVPTNVNTDGASIASDEYRNKGITDINYNFAYVAIDFTASVTIKVNCITPECDFTLADIPVPDNTPCFFTSCQDLKAYIDSRTLIGFKKITLTSGNIDGINKVFVWDKAPLFVLWNGQKLTEGAVVNGYTIVGTTITMTEAPQIGDSLEAYGNY